MLLPADLSPAERRVVHALASRCRLFAVRNHFRAQGDPFPIDKRTVACVIGKGLAAPDGAEVRAVPATMEMHRRIQRRVRQGYRVRTKTADLSTRRG